jgi:hypothetical protein
MGFCFQPALLNNCGSIQKMGFFCSPVNLIFAPFYSYVAAGAPSFSAVRA